MIVAAADDAEAVWTLDLHVRRPIHPERLHDRLEELGTGRMRSRGYLWLPTRPTTPVVWDGCGGQLRIGAGPGWSDDPATRLVVTGLGVDERDRIERLFAELLCTDPELAGPGSWLGRGDAFSPWLGAPEERGSAGLPARPGRQ